MLKNIDPRLSPDLLRDLAVLGHNERVLIADQNFPVGKFTVPVHYIPLPSTEILAAVLTVFPLEVSADDCVMLMTNTSSAPLDEYQRAIVDVVRKAEPEFADFDKPDVGTGFLPAAFSAAVVIVSGDIAYSSYILRRGIAY